jgi:hypothetical protein
MLKTLKWIWHDPVWSKVIAVAIVTLFGATGVHFDWWRRLLIPYTIPAWLLALLIALTFLSLALFLWKRHQFGEATKDRTESELESNITKIDITIPPVDKSRSLTYPLKCSVQLRNDSATCADVRISAYRPGTVTLKAFVIDVLQIKLRDWTPSDHGVDRLAVLPGQLFRAWIGVDDSKFTADQLNLLRGKIGTLVLLVNGKQVNIDL